MDFAYVIVFSSRDGKIITRTGTGVFYPTDIRAFRLEDQLWAICEEYNVRPDCIDIHVTFRGDFDGPVTPKRIEGPEAATE